MYLELNNSYARSLENVPPAANFENNNTGTTPDDFANLKEDEVDIILMKQNGYIERKMNPNL